MTSLERTPHSRYARPAELKRVDLDDVKRRGDAAPIPLPLKQNVLEDGEDSQPDRRDAPWGSANPYIRKLEAAPPDPPPARALPRHGTSIESANRPDSRHGARHVIGEPRTLAPTPAPRRVAVELARAPDPQNVGERGTLPWANVPRRSPEMVAVLEQADEHVRQGFRLAERNALYLARAEFIAALELVAEANDVRQNARFYSDALTVGLAALAESGDFVRRRPVGKQIDIARIVSGHKTPILKNGTLDRLVPTLAAQRYYTYAQEQLAAAAAGEAHASTALFGLGKAAVALGEGSPAQRLEGTAQAMVLYQAALMADARNFRAANELGVILARQGDWVRARDLLIHSVRLSPHPATHRNLAAVYRKLGEAEFAKDVTLRAIAMEQAGYRGAGPAVQWVDPTTFAGTAPASDSLLPPAAGPTSLPGTETLPPTDEKAASTAKRGITDWLPWNSRR